MRTRKKSCKIYNILEKKNYFIFGKCFCMRNYLYDVKSWIGNFIHCPSRDFQCIGSIDVLGRIRKCMSLSSEFCPIKSVPHDMVVICWVASRFKFYVWRTSLEHTFLWPSGILWKQTHPSLNSSHQIIEFYICGKTNKRLCLKSAFDRKLSLQHEVIMIDFN